MVKVKCLEIWLTASSSRWYNDNDDDDDGRTLWYVKMTDHFAEVTIACIHIFLLNGFAHSLRETVVCRLGGGAISTLAALFVLFWANYSQKNKTTPCSPPSDQRTAL